MRVGGIVGIALCLSCIPLPFYRLASFEFHRYVNNMVFSGGFTVSMFYFPNCFLRAIVAGIEAVIGDFWEREIEG